jgi:hypothetical protein
MEPRPPQKLYTKKYGELDVIRSWNEPPNHIALLENGAYVHITGVPIADKSVLRKTIHDIPDLENALLWFDHRHDEKAEDKMRVMIEPDGSFVFEDGNPITSVSQLTQALQPGPVLDAALLWFTRAKDVAEAEAKLNKDPHKPPVKAKPKGAAKKAARKATKTAAAQV